MSTIASHSPLNILETVQDRGLIVDSKRPPIGIGLRESNDHVTADVT